MKGNLVQISQTMSSLVQMGAMDGGDLGLAEEQAEMASAEAATQTATASESAY